jgi:hypothetical protein
MNVNDILSEGEEILYKGQQHRYVPGGKEITPGQIFVTNQRSQSAMVKSVVRSEKRFRRSSLFRCVRVDLKMNVFSCDLIIRSRDLSPHSASPKSDDLDTGPG